MAFFILFEVWKYNGLDVLEGFMIFFKDKKNLKI